MLLQSMVLPASSLTTVTESTSIQEALDILETSGFRCIPVLDDTNTLFRGNIYRMHIYKHQASHGDMSLPVTHLLKNATKYINVNASFFKIFFTIKELPYIAVLDEHKHFFGIITHNKLLNILEQGWNIDQGRYVLTIHSTSQRGSLAHITKIISKYSSILNCITLDDDQHDTRRTIITLPAETTPHTRDAIIHHLERKHFPVIEVEDLHPALY